MFRFFFKIKVLVLGLQIVVFVSLVYNCFFGNRVNNMYVSFVVYYNGVFVYGSVISNYVGLQLNMNNLNFFRLRDVVEGRIQQM